MESFEPNPGDTLLVTMRFEDETGHELRLTHFVADVVIVLKGTIHLRLITGEPADLPFDVESLSPTDETYLLESGTIVRPRFITSWTNRKGKGIRPEPGLPRPPRAPNSDEGDSAQGVFDPVRAQALTGKSIIVGITYREGTPDDRRTQFFGRIELFTEKEVMVRLARGKTLSLPPDARAFRWAPPGDYSLTATNDVVRDPDVLTQWVSTGDHPTGAGILRPV